MRRTLLITGPLLALLAACGTRPAAPPSAATPPSTGAPAPRATLASESARLAELFRGTPVVLAMQPDASLRVLVPRANSFEPGSSKVRPALGAVLERLARSPAQPGWRFKVAAPGDAPGRAGTLVSERALSLRDYLVGHGVGVTRVQVLATVPADAVELVVSETPPR